MAGYGPDIEVCETTRLGFLALLAQFDSFDDCLHFLWHLAAKVPKNN